MRSSRRAHRPIFGVIAFMISVGCGGGDEDECEAGASACQNGVARNCRAIGAGPAHWEEQRCLAGELCSSGAGSPAICVGCNVDPWQCGAAETCSIIDGQGHTGCVASGAGGLGDPCQGTIGAAECGPGLVCIALSGSGSCSRYCDPARADRGCAAGESCQAVVLRLERLPILNVCLAGS